MPPAAEASTVGEGPQDSEWSNAGMRLLCQLRAEEKAFVSAGLGSCALHTIRGCHVFAATKKTWLTSRRVSRNTGLGWMGQVNVLEAMILGAPAAG